MSGQASAKMSLDAGLEPVMQFQTRDRSRYGLESDALGAAALGIRNILCLSGDYLRLGPDPLPKPDQIDMDALQLLWMLRRMRDEEEAGIPQPVREFCADCGNLLPREKTTAVAAAQT